MALIETCDIRKRFKLRHSVVEAVRGVTLRVEAGEIFGFLGPNGAGKTTTLRMLTTLLPPDDGQALVAGYDLLRQPAHIREHIGYVSQAGGVDIHATGRENLLLQARLYRVRQARERTNELLALLQLERYADRVARTYSGGERRRLDLAMGMVHKPQLLFLDEPTTGLDPQSRAHLWEEIRVLCAGGTTIFLTTHYLEEADALCHRLAILDQGTIVAEGTPQDLKRALARDVITLGLEHTQLSRVQEIFRGQAFVQHLQMGKEEVRLYVEHAEAVLMQVLQLLSHHQLILQTLTLAHPTLDDVFLHVTGRTLREEGKGEGGNG